MSNTSTLSRRSFVAGALATAAAIAAAGAAGNVALADQKVYDSDAQGARDGGEMKWYITNPVAIEPFGAEENQGVQVMNCTYDTLTDYDWEKGEIVPLACESYESNDDATQFTFHLKKDLTFHNGKPVTAADYKYSWERICKPDFKPQPSSLAYKLNMIKGAKEMQAGQATEMEGIECPDDYTLVVNLTQPFSDFDGQVADYATAAVPAGSTDDEASFQAFRTHPVGNGPFKVDDNGWVDSQYVRVVRNDAYTGEKPHLDAITFVVYKDDQTAWTEFQAGNLDFTLLPSGQFTAAEATYGKADKDGYVANPGHQTLDGEETSIFASQELFEAALRAKLPQERRATPLRFDIARCAFRPTGSSLRNFLYRPETDDVVSLMMDDGIKQSVKSFRICRVYGRSEEGRDAIISAFNSLTGGVVDDVTNV